MQYLRTSIINSNQGDLKEFPQQTFESDSFQNTYSEYFMSSLKDQLSFYYSKKDYNHFIKLFEFFDKPDFTYEEYNQCYIKFTESS